MGSREGEAEPGLGTGEGSPTGGVDAEGAQWVGRGGGGGPWPRPPWVPRQPPGLWSQRPQDSSGPESRSPTSPQEKRRPQGEHWRRARRDPGPRWVLLASRAHGDPQQLTEKIKQALCVGTPLLSPLLRPLDLELLVLGDHSRKGQILGV